MPSPFPGMDPFLEDPIEWSDLHVRLMVEFSRQLTAQVSPALLPSDRAWAASRVAAWREAHAG